MPQLKRKRTSPDPESTSPFDASYFMMLPEGLAELADVEILVENQKLPAHSFVLSKSPVLLAAISAATTDTQRICQLPLPGETRQDVFAALMHMYLESLRPQHDAEARVLARFGHKYNIPQLHKLSEKYLVGSLEQMKERFDHFPELFDWAQFAARFELNTLLAHCERDIIDCFSSMPAAEKKLSQVSHKSLLRIMAGLNGKAAPLGWIQDTPYSATLRLCEKCNVLSDSAYCGCGPFSPMTGKARDVKVSHKTAQEIAKSMTPSVECLLKWQKD